jgi:hypothetical protein
MNEDWIRTLLEPTTTQDGVIVPKRSAVYQPFPMDTAVRNSQWLEADGFRRTDQSDFGPAWRYELVRSTIVAHAVPSPEHSVILGNLAGEL